MRYLIFDLEFNQKLPNNNDIETNSVKKDLLFEIIQIGAFIIDDNFKVISTFNKLIKPTIHTTLHPYIETLTNITDEDLSTAETFPVVFKQFIEFLGNHHLVLVVWGTADIKELLQNIAFYNLPTSRISKKYIDIQSYTSLFFKCDKGSKIGLKSAVEKLSIPLNGEFHNAFNDAYYTCEIFKKLYSPNVKSSTYSLTLNKKRKTTPKEAVDLNSLFIQFEKTFKKKLSQEEKSMIRLAYFMGKTNQFSKEKKN